MHGQAYDWVKASIPWVTSHVGDRGFSVLELGSLDVNGTVRELFPFASKYVGLNKIAGPEVDVVADVCEWNPPELFDVVVSTEMLEHCHDWRAALATARKALRLGGVLVLTCAGPGRAPHGEHGAQTPDTGEFYENVEPEELKAELTKEGWEEVVVDVLGADVRAVALKEGAA